MSTNAVLADRERRWASESAFFDAEAERHLANIRRIDPAVIARYSGPLRRYNPEEFRYRLLGDLRGRRVLDVGCGDGLNAVLLARLGADVTGIDISPKAIEAAKRRAQINGVADRCRFLCSPLETAEIDRGSFDIVWGDAILHHLLPELDTLLPRIKAAARPGGLVVFGEPINLNPRLRALRLKVPVATHATPDERPLEPQDLAILERHFPGLEVAPFGFLGRLCRLLIPDFHYESAPRWRRRALDLLERIDRVLFAVRPFRQCASRAVLWASR